MNKTIEKLLNSFSTHPYMARMGANKIAKQQKCSVADVYEARALYRGKKNKFISSLCEEVGIDVDNVKSFWYKDTKSGTSINVKAESSFNLSDLKDEIIKEMEEYSPKYNEIKRTKSKDAHLLVVDVADLHIGKLSSSFETGEDYNNQIAIKRAKEGVQGLLDKSAGFNIDKILFIAGNDILHIDNPKRTTSAGTPQDTDGMWYDNFLLAKQLYVDILEMLLPIADVHFQYDPSNHDYTNGFFLADTIRTWFRNNKNITFNTSISHRKYFTYGENLIATTHGDGAKETDLPLLMAQEAAKDWAVCPHRYFYTHHIHHKRSRDYGSVCVESLRSPSGTDSWHHRNGYVHSPKAVEAFIHHPKHGQIARLTNIF